MSQQYSEAKIIASPISGQPVRPQLKTYRTGNTEVTEAHYIDPASGAFIRKAVVSTREINSDVDKKQG